MTFKLNKGQIQCCCLILYIAHTVVNSTIIKAVRWPAVKDFASDRHVPHSNSAWGTLIFHLVYLTSVWPSLANHRLRSKGPKQMISVQH